MANPFDAFKDIEIDALRNLKQAKDAYGTATTDQQRQEASALGDSIRAKAGIKADSAGLLNAQQLDELIKERESSIKQKETVPTVNSTPENPLMDTQALANKIAETKKAQALAKFNQQFAQTQGRLEQERSQIDPRFLDATGRTQTQGAMSQRAMENAMAQGGLATSGARFQSELGLRGQQLAQQGMNERDRLGQIADVERRTTEAQQLRDLGIGGIEAEADITNLQSQLTQMEQQEALAREDAKVAEQQERLDFGNKILANYNDLQAFANQLIEQGAPQWKIDQVLAARTQKTMEQGLDPVTGQPLPRDTTPELSASAAMGLWEQIGVANEAISRALGIDPGTRFTRQAVASSGGGGLSAASIASLAKWKFDNGVPLNEQEASILGVDPGYTAPPTGGDSTNLQGGLPFKTIISSLDNLVSNLQDPRVNELMKQLDTLDPNKDFIAREGIIEQINLLQKQNPDFSKVKRKVLNAMVENDNWFTPQTLLETLALYNITPQELANFEAMRESAINDRPFE